MDFETMDLALKRRPTKRLIKLEVKKIPLLELMVPDTKFDLTLKSKSLSVFLPNRYYQYGKEVGAKQIQDMRNQGRPIYILNTGAASKTDVYGATVSNDNAMQTQITDEIQSLALENGRSLCIETFGMSVLFNYTKPVYDQILGWFCPAYWDDILCWPNTPANTFATTRCPSYIVGFDKPLNNATRQCMDDGLWYINQELHKYWTNYTQCFGSDQATVVMELPDSKISGTLIESYIPLLKIISRVGYAVSLCTLLVAFIILFSIKRLHCPRNNLHMNLFASFIFRAFLLLLKDVLFVEGVGLSSVLKYKDGETFFYENRESNNWGCKLFTSLWEFFITANHSWILMEGLYLHNLIFRALFADSSSNITHYIVLGWGLPVLVIVPWIATRLLVEDTFCWTTHEEKKMTFLIIRIPITISILVNTILFLRIAKVLFSKLRSSQSEEAKRYQKWAKSTLVLVPLFGVHYAVFMGMSYYIGRNEVVELIWLICDLLFASFQGFFVAILYCFLNGEVRTELKPHFNAFISYLCSCRADDLRTIKSRSSVCTMLSSTSLYNNSNHHRHRTRCYCLHPPRQLLLADKNKEHKEKATAVHSWHDISPRKSNKFIQNGQYSPASNMKYQKQDMFFPRDSIMGEKQFAGDFKWSINSELVTAITNQTKHPAIELPVEDSKTCPNCYNEHERCKSEPQLGIELTNILPKDH